MSDPTIPEALAPVVQGVVALHNFPKHANVRQNGVYRRYKGSNQLEPLFTYGNPANYAVGPGDWAKIYSVPTTATGAGQTIAIVADSNINTQDVVNFRSMFKLPAYSNVCPNDTLPTTCPLSVIVNGPDPGLNLDEGEADLDVQWAGAIAPAAQIILVVSEATMSNPAQVSQGIDLSALYIVDNNIAPVLSESFGVCEGALGTAGNQFYNELWQQAAAQGITVVVSAGDSGSAGCDSSFNSTAASGGVAANGIASTPFDVAIGGTDFDPSTTGNATYWSPNTSGDVINSALAYIPEIVWDDSACALAPTTPCTTVDTTNGADLSAGGGAPSNCSVVNGSGNCTSGYAKPPYQTGVITPNDSVRDTPDVSFFSSNGGPVTGGSKVSLVVCQIDFTGGTSCNLNTPYADFALVGGTSAATPTFAAIMALVNQSTGQRQGNANYVLYALAAGDTNYSGSKCTSSVGQTPASGCVFNDVTKGNNTVACVAGTQNCSNTTGNSAPYGVLQCTTTAISSGAICPAVDNGATAAFAAGAGYDLATGLGSINVGNLLSKWTSASRTATTTTVTSATGGSPSGTTVTATIAVSPAPTGTFGENVSLLALGSTGTVLGSFGPFPLTSGSASASTNLLPPGTASVEGTYGGDATLGASTSPAFPLPGTVAGANQTSTLTVYYVGFDSNGNPTTPTTGSQNFVYGSGNGYILKLVVTGSNANGCSFSPPSTKPAFPCPTGTIKLFDNGNALTDFLQNGTPVNQATLNNNGIAEDQPINVNVGTHAITATYGGDANYAATSSSNTLTLTVTQATTTTAIASSASTIMPGTNVTLTATVNTTSGGVGPTGSVAFTSNGNSIGSGTCTPTAANISTGAPAFCTASLTVAISSVYPPTGDPTTPTIPRVPLILALLSLVLFVLGLRWVPQTRRRAYAYAGLLAIALLVGVVAGCGGGGGGGGGGGAGTRTIGASYAGDTNYKGSTAPTVQIIVQ